MMARSSSSSSSSSGGGGEKEPLLPKTLPVRSRRYQDRGAMDDSTTTTVDKEEVAAVGIVGDIVLETGGRGKKEKEVETATLVDIVDERNVDVEEEGDGSWVMNRSARRAVAQAAEEGRRAEARARERERERHRGRGRGKGRRSARDEADSAVEGVMGASLALARREEELRHQKKSTEEKARKRPGMEQKERVVEPRSESGAEEEDVDEVDFIPEHMFGMVVAQARYEENKRRKKASDNTDQVLEKKKEKTRRQFFKKKKQADPEGVIKEDESSQSDQGDYAGDEVDSNWGERAFGMEYAAAKYQRNKQRREGEGDCDDKADLGERAFGMEYAAAKYERNKRRTREAEGEEEERGRRTGGRRKALPFFRRHKKQEEEEEEEKEEGKGPPNATEGEGEEKSEKGHDDVADRGSFGMELAAGIRMAKKQKEGTRESKESDRKREEERVNAVTDQERKARADGEAKREGPHIHESRKDESDFAPSFVLNYGMEKEIGRVLAEKKHHQDGARRQHQVKGKGDGQKEEEKVSGKEGDKFSPEGTTEGKGDEADSGSMAQWAVGREIGKALAEAKIAKKQEEEVASKAKGRKEKEEQKETKVDEGKDNKEEESDNADASIASASVEASMLLGKLMGQRAGRKAAKEEEEQKKEKEEEKRGGGERQKDGEKNKNVSAERNPDDADGNFPVKFDPAIVQAHARREEEDRRRPPVKADDHLGKKQPEAEEDELEEKEKKHDGGDGDDPDGLQRARVKVLDAFGSAHKAVEKMLQSGHKEEGREEEAQPKGETRDEDAGNEKGKKGGEDDFLGKKEEGSNEQSWEEAVEAMAEEETKRKLAEKEKEVAVVEAGEDVDENPGKTASSSSSDDDDDDGKETSTA